MNTPFLIYPRWLLRMVVRHRDGWSGRPDRRNCHKDHPDGCFFPLCVPGRLQRSQKPGDVETPGFYLRGSRVAGSRTVRRITSRGLVPRPFNPRGIPAGRERVSWSRVVFNGLAKGTRQTGVVQVRGIDAGSSGGTPTGTTGVIPIPA